MPEPHGVGGQAQALWSLTAPGWKRTEPQGFDTNTVGRSAKVAPCAEVDGRTMAGPAVDGRTMAGPEVALQYLPALSRQAQMANPAVVDSRYLV